jgi:hypothetical protein
MILSTIVVTRKEGGLEEFAGVTQYTVHNGFLILQWPAGKQHWLNADDVLEIQVQSEGQAEESLSL